MQQAHKLIGVSPVGEMAIVDTFTKLIFGEPENYSREELLIIQALRMVDTTVLFDSHRDMGEYLRALGVGEMVQLVSRVQRHMRELAASGRGPAGGGPGVNQSAIGGRIER